MTELIVSTLSTAFIISALDELVYPLGKWRGLPAILMGILSSYYLLELNWGKIVFTGLAAAFGGMTLSMLVKTLIQSSEPRSYRRLPQRIPPL